MKALEDCLYYLARQIPPMLIIVNISIFVADNILLPSTSKFPKSRVDYYHLNEIIRHNNQHVNNNLKGVQAMQENQKIRTAARGAGVPLWRIAVALGVSEPTIIRWLRVPFTPEREAEFLAIIDRLSAEEG